MDFVAGKAEKFGVKLVSYAQYVVSVNDMTLRSTLTILVAMILGFALVMVPLSLLFPEFPMRRPHVQPLITWKVVCAGLFALLCAIRQIAEIRKLGG